MSDTPETDAAAERNIYGVACKVDVEFARKLERERDEAREALRDLCDKIALRMMAENPDKERLDLIESHKRAEAVLEDHSGGGGVSDTPNHACIARLHGLVRQVANPLETLMGIPARLQQAWQCPECGKTEWKDVPIVTVEEAAK